MIFLTMPMHEAAYPKSTKKLAEPYCRNSPIVWGEWTTYIGDTIRRVGSSDANVVHIEVKQK